MSDPSGSRPRWVVDLALTCALATMIVGLSFFPAIKEFNRRLTDGYHRLQKTHQASDVTVVTIDDASLQRYGRWPWSRTILARLVRTISSANPRVIGIDILLSEPQSQDSDADLRDAIQQSGRVILVDKIGSFPDGPRWMEPLPQFAHAAWTIGHAQAVLDADGICRSFPPEELSLSGPRYAFAIEVARHIDRQRTDSFLSRYALHYAGSEESVVRGSPMLIPIPFRSDGIASISAAQLLAGKELERLRDKIVLIGFGPVEIGDRITTPISRDLPTPGVEIHAQIVDGILAGRSVRALSTRYYFALLILISIAAIQAFRRWHGWKTIPGVVVFGATLYMGGAAAFHSAGWILPIGDLLLATIVAPLLIYGVDFAAVERSIGAQMHLLQDWLAYRDSDPQETTTDLSWRLKVLRDLQSELGLRFELYRELLEATRDLVAVFDADGLLLFSNASFNDAWAPTVPSSLLQVHARLIESRDAPLSDAGSTREGEARLHGALYSIRMVPLPATSVTPKGGTLLSMTSLHLRVELDRARSEALGFVTHELRTPLVAIQGFAELMTRYPESKANARAPETILRESRRLLALINSYLDVLRTDAGARPLRTDTINVSRMIQQVFALLAPIAQASAVRLVLQCDDRLTLQADEPLLTGAVLNLVSNAIKYGKSESEVFVVAELRDAELSLTVHNIGEPIAEEELQSVFGTFLRGKKDEEKPGWGLGLSFVKRIAEKHNGRVSVQSSAAEGTTFTLEIPGARAAIGASSQ